MAEQKHSAEKRVHRLEPKQQSVVLPSATTPQVDASLKNAQHMMHSPHAEQKSHEERIEDAWGQELHGPQTGQRGLFICMSVFCAFFLACAIWALVLINSGEDKQSGELELAGDSLSFDEKIEIRNAAVTHYLSAATVEEKARYVRDPERVLPLMKSFYAQYPLRPEKVRSSLIEAPVMGKQGVLWRVKAKEEALYGSLYLLVETNDDGTSRIDWETDVVYQPSDWKTFIEEKSTEVHTFRVYAQIAQLDGFHGFEFSEYSKFRCFKVTFPKSDDYLWAYTEIGSEEDKKLVNLITSGGRRNINSKRTVPMTLELRYPENGQSARCVHLHRLVKAGWLH